MQILYPRYCSALVGTEEGQDDVRTSVCTRKMNSSFLGPFGARSVVLCEEETEHYIYSGEHSYVP